ncbi:hydroxypyruvate isomerase family protein [Gibbsiella quercinecans]|uniref:hydroxypyruvate isomerase family protein n=1 Tax=Gibbsiella quercinecans TaxID=929813 RepID=UPI003A4D2AD0
MFYPNIGFLFTEYPLAQRFAAAKQCGFDIVECPNPYSIPLDELTLLLKNSRVSIASMNMPSGDPAQGEFGFAGVPGKEAVFFAHWQTALAYATALGVKKIHVTAGIVEPQQRQAALATLVKNLRAIAQQAAAANIILLLEPINQRDMPGYLVSHSDRVAQLIGEIGADNIKLLFDVYHIQIMEGDLINRIERYAEIIGHVQIAGVPARHEPDEGEVNFRAVISAFKRIGFRDPIALEYRPRGKTEEGLNTLKTLAV